MSSEALERLLKATDVYLSKLMHRKEPAPPSPRGGTVREQHILDDDGVDSRDEEEEFVVSTQPSLIQGEMRNYQIEGLDWLAHLTRNGVNGILADEMGLGKTLQSISILALVKERNWPEDKYPHLIVVPKSTITNWEKEFLKFCPIFKTCCLIGSQEERETIISSRVLTGDFDVLITSFDIARIEIGALRKIKFGFFILDEAHRIKNEESILSSIVRMITAERILLLTGTPLQNNLHELWAILNFIMPHIFDSAKDFDEIFNQLMLSAAAETNEIIASTLHRILRPFMLRRLKTDVARDLPDKKELYVYVPLSNLQKEIYRDIIIKNADSVLNTNSVGKVRLVNTLMQLRKCCNHPYLFPGIEPGPPFVDGPHLVMNSGKMTVLEKLVDKIIFEKSNEGNQILIFSQMTKMLDILDDFFRFKKIPHCRIDGSTASSDRQSMIDDFVSPNTDKRVFLLSTRAGGLGINLVSANFVFIFDSDFNPQSDLQAIDRAHRIGQKRPVTVYRFVTRNTVEEKIVEKAAKKMLIDRLVIQKGKFGSSKTSEDVTKDEMSHILKFGVSELFASTNESSSEDIEALMEFSEKRTSELTEKLKSFDSFILKFDNPLAVDSLGEQAEPSPLPEEVVIAAQNMVPPLPEESVILVEGPRERKPVIPAAPKRVTAPPVIKTKLAEWRAKVGGGHEYQFFQDKRLDELEKIEKEKGSLTRYEKAEQEKLMSEGFPNFSRRCFQTVTRYLEEIGYSDYAIDLITEALPEWSREEIERYIETLLSNGKKFLGPIFMSRLLNKIKKIETNTALAESRMTALDRKIKSFKSGPDDNIWVSLPVDSAPIEDNSGWTNDVDRVLLCATFAYGYGAWSAIRQLTRSCPLTCHNFAVHAKPVEEIKGRIDELLEIVEEEFPAPKSSKKRKSNP
jgi:SWI/SNF-related matrix-associated actin-dependent regulator of chromatin subfamily A member 5